ncbi:hypothetical protein, partial [Burkholderia ubonensis]|uniref:hypothetical protein n=1 Tax=Burkholderia ubonensis TaxID=101571 RepID=UPI000A925669
MLTGHLHFIPNAKLANRSRATEYLPYAVTCLISSGHSNLGEWPRLLRFPKEVSYGRVLAFGLAKEGFHQCGQLLDSAQSA